jgi:hypothetical protein
MMNLLQRNVSAILTDHDRFALSTVKGNTTPMTFLIFTCSYVLASALMILPLLCFNTTKGTLKRRNSNLAEETQGLELDDMRTRNRESMTNTARTDGSSARDLFGRGVQQRDSVLQNQDVDATVQNEGIHGDTSSAQNTIPPPLLMDESLHNYSLELSAPMAHFSPGALSKSNNNNNNNNNYYAFAQVPAAEQHSAVSAATTTRIHSGRKRNLRWVMEDVRTSARILFPTQLESVRIKGRAQSIRRSVASERQSAASEEGGSAASRGASWTLPPGKAPLSQHSRSMMSDAATSVLDEEVVAGEAAYYRNRYMQRSRKSRQRSTRSLTTASEQQSVLQPLEADALSPDDAADASDPGREAPVQFYNEESPALPFAWLESNKGPMGFLAPLFELVEPEFETQRILRLAFPIVALGIADPIQRLVLISILSYFVGVEAMIAFVLTILLLRLTTEEVSAAIVDTEATMIHNAMAHGGEAAFYLTGQYMQLALIMQIFFLGPILLMWVFCMDRVVAWLASGAVADIAVLAGQYARIIVVDYIIRGCTKTLILPFRLKGQDYAARNTEIVGTILTILAIVVVVKVDVNFRGQPTLVVVGIVQVIGTATKAIVKIAFVFMKGWFTPFKLGFFGELTLKVSKTYEELVGSLCTRLSSVVRPVGDLAVRYTVYLQSFFAAQDSHQCGVFFVTALPLFLGSLLELREVS